MTAYRAMAAPLKACLKQQSDQPAPTLKVVISQRSALKAHHVINNAEEMAAVLRHRGYHAKVIWR